MRASAAAQHFPHLADTVEHGSGGQGNPIPTDRHYLRREGTNRYLPGHRASSCGVRANAGEIKPAQEWQAIATRNRRVQPIRSLKFSATSLTLGKEAGPQSGPCRSLIPSWRGLSCKIRWRVPGNYQVTGGLLLLRKRCLSSDHSLEAIRCLFQPRSQASGEAPDCCRQCLHRRFNEGALWTTRCHLERRRILRNTI